VLISAFNYKSYKKSSTGIKQLYSRTDELHKILSTQKVTKVTMVYLLFVNYTQMANFSLFDSFANV